MRYQRGLPADASDKTGILIVNLGTPDAATPGAVRRYLAEFLHDHRVVELSRWIWCLILHGIVLRLRPRKSAAAYAKIWEETGSPLMSRSRDMAHALGERMSDRFGGRVKVEIGRAHV